MHTTTSCLPGLSKELALAIAALTACVSAQEPGSQGPGSLERRIDELERLVRQNRIGAQPQDASVSLSWIRADTAGVPDFQDAPKTPGVAATVDVKLWGRVNFAANYDNFQGNGGIGGADFQNFVTAEGNEEVNFNPRDTRFGFAAANSWDDWVGRAVVEIDFYGDTSTSNLQPRLRLGYVELTQNDGWSIRAGQDWVPVAQQNPGTIEFGIFAWSGNLWGRVPQITVRKKFGEDGNHEVLVGAMHNRTLNAQDQQERMPWAVARYGWNGTKDWKGLFAVGGAVRSASVSNAAGTVAEDVSNWMVGVEGRAPITSMITLTGEAWTGAGIGREFMRANLDYSATADEVGGTGGFASLEWRLSDAWVVNAGIGVDQPDDGDTTPTTLYGSAIPYDANRSVFGNVRYQLSKQAGIGVEFMDFETELVTGATPSGDDGQVLRGQRFTIGTWFIF